jgi:hypothetical protein
VHVTVMPSVSMALGAIGLPREMLIKVIAKLYQSLENDHERSRKNRDPEDPDCLFDYILRGHDGESWHTLRFSVDDRQAEGRLFVVAVSHKADKDVL